MAFCPGPEKVAEFVRSVGIAEKCVFLRVYIPQMSKPWRLCQVCLFSFYTGGLGHCGRL